MKIGGTNVIDFARVSRIPKFVVNIKEGDSKRKISLTLLENNMPVNLDNYNVVAACKKSDGNDIFNKVNIVDGKNGKCEIEVTGQMLALDSDLPCEIVLYGANGVVATSSNFVIGRISSIRDEKSIVSSGEFTALTKAMSEIKNIDNKIWSMANMGQDVKEAMTGGSVAVVGINAVGTNNIINNSVSSAKRTVLGENIHYVHLSLLPTLDISNNTLTFPSGSKLTWRNKVYDITTECVVNFSGVGSVNIKIYYDTVKNMFHATGLTWDVEGVDLEQCIVVATGSKSNPYWSMPFEYNIKGKTKVYKEELPDIIEDNTKGVVLGENIHYVHLSLLPTLNISNNTLTFPSGSKLTWRNKVYDIRTESVVDFSDVGTANIKIYFDTVKNMFHATGLTWDIEGVNLDQCIVVATGSKSNPYWSMPFEYNIKGKTKVCKEEVVTMIQEFNDGNNVPDYVLNNIDEINNKITYDYLDNFKFSFMTDVHGDNSHYKYLKELTDYGQLQACIIGGDINHYNDESSLEGTKKQMLNISKYLYNYKPVVLTSRGNHDGVLGNSSFDNKCFTNVLIKPFNNTSKSYYYKDFENEKIRIIVLNSSEDTQSRCGFSIEQCNWFDNTLNSTNSDWCVVTVSHHHLLSKYSTVMPTPNNADLIVNSIKKFKSKNNNFIGHWFGHTHYDLIDNVEGINYICTVNSFCAENKADIEEGKTYERIRGTKSEYAIDVVCIDQKTKTVNLVRFGAGGNRTFTY